MATTRSLPLRRLLHVPPRSTKSVTGALSDGVDRLDAMRSTSSSFGSGSESGSGSGSSSLPRSYGDQDDNRISNMARNFLSARGNVRPKEEPGRKKFVNGQLLAPHQFTRSNLYGPDPIFPRQPLLGPPNRLAKQIDPFHITSTSPLSYIWNPEFSRGFTNNLGRILGRAETGLTWKNQRMVGKMVRRARAMGLVGKWGNRNVQGGFGSIRSYDS